MDLHVLPPDVASRIAAGEVVERPSSVVKEIVENSLDTRASKIDIECRQGGVDLICVADNGSGIPEDELDKIFEKFYRGRATAGQKVVGNGLGLALSREIATLHGGDIKVTSAVGQGSKFTFLLPAAETSRKVS